MLPFNVFNITSLNLSAYSKAYSNNPDLYKDTYTAADLAWQFIDFSGLNSISVNAL